MNNDNVWNILLLEISIGMVMESSRQIILFLLSESSFFPLKKIVPTEKTLGPEKEVFCLPIPDNSNGNVVVCLSVQKFANLS